MRPGVGVRGGDLGGHDGWWGGGLEAVECFWMGGRSELGGCAVANGYGYMETGYSEAVSQTTICVLASLFCLFEQVELFLLINCLR